MNGQHALIQDGDVFAFRGRGFWAAAIKLRTFSRVTHVGFAIRVRGVLCALEAREKIGVRIFPLELYERDSNMEVDWYQFKSGLYPDVTRAAIIERAISHLGCSYASAWQFVRSFGLLSEPLCDKLGIRHVTNYGRFFCSQYVLASLREAGYQGDREVHPALASPGDIIELECLERRGRVA